jgi:L-fuculokinase
MQKDIAIIFDCGATNVRVIAMDTSGKILASHAMANETDEDPHYPGGRIWDLDKLWNKLCTAATKVTGQIDAARIAGVSVTTFGVDGAFVDESGAPIYPIISWQCQRTAPIMNSIDKYVPLKDLYQTSGVYPYAFNTINKMIWFKENRPDIIEQAHGFLFIPSLLINKLSGQLINDATMLGTAMMANLKERKLSDKILKSIGLDKNLFGKIGEPGDKAGEITEKTSTTTGLPVGTPVYLAGHDTQFAIFGSGAEINQPVLSSGTWEVLMTRSHAFSSSPAELEDNLTTECDAINGIYNIGQNWLGSGILEWFSRNFYAELKGDDLYNAMIKDAESELPGAQGISVDPAFYDDGSSINSGTIKGLTISTSRGQIYRAFLESLAFRLREGLEALEAAGKFKAERIICVGGGSKNRLWNQLRADVCKVPIQLIDQKETTVLGASLFVFAGAGLYSSVEKARLKIDYNPTVIQPSANRDIYDQLYQNYIEFKR